MTNDLVEFDAPKCGPGDGLICACGAADTREHHERRERRELPSLAEAVDAFLNATEPAPPSCLCCDEPCREGHSCGAACCRRCSIMCRGYCCDQCSSQRALCEQGVTAETFRCVKPECGARVAGTIGGEVYCVGCGEQLRPDIAWVVRTFTEQEVPE